MRYLRKSVAALGVTALMSGAAGYWPSSEAGADSGQPAQSAKTTMHIDGGTIEVEIEPGEWHLPRTPILNWVRAAAKSVSTYFGAFPIKKTRIAIVPHAGKGVGFSTATYEGDCGVITVSVGRHTTSNDLDRDWVLTHEMIHLGFPLMGRRHRWLAEGMATYVEPLARMRLGLIPADEVWGDLVQMLPHGIPKRGDKGLNHTPTWGRTYWGGALYFLLADVEIRRRTSNKRGLEHALGAIAHAGGDITSEWEPVYALEIGDRAAGSPVLTDLYNRMKETPVNVDLPRLWRLLGVSSKDGKVMFDDRAPLAHVRHAINRGT